MQNYAWGSYFYLGMSLLILVLVTAMFSTTVPTRLLHPKIAPPYIVWLTAPKTTAHVSRVGLRLSEVGGS
ncbi:hypothetical protein [Tunturiibacter lichenicola]|uniref:hypothetical protein n=1 Tax=Tunturiibacter lichenicola TaxID=2051959 RepID=UPI003D9B4147